MITMIDLLNRKNPVITERNEQGCDLVVSHKPKKHGHIELQIDGIKRYIHRVVYENIFGKIPEGLVVRHKCDNPNCINIEHLELGTHADNVADRVERERSATGVDNGRAKLTEDDVRFIRSDNTHNNTELSKMFSVDAKVIRNVKSFKSWKHVV